MINEIINRIWRVIQLTVDYLYDVVMVLLGQQIVEIPYEEPEVEEPQPERERIGFK